MNLFNIVTLFFCVQLITYTESINESCRTPNGTAGQCINIRECPSLLLLISDSYSTGDAQYLKDSNCEYDKVEAIVCCPLEKNTKALTNIPNEKTLKELPNAYLLPTTDICGTFETYRIKSGTFTKLGEFPWMVLLGYQTPTELRYDCGGSLINDRYVLTAAHCVAQEVLPKFNTLVTVRIGEHTLSTNPDCEPFGNTIYCAIESYNVGISEKILHNHYRSSDVNHYHDIALLRLESVISFTAYVKPICLPLTQDFLESNLYGENMTVAGWGKTENSTSSNEKLKLEIPIISTPECESVYNIRNIRIGSGQLCAGGIQEKDSCQGDSGGPLMSIKLVEDSNNWYAFGLVSFGPTACGQAGIPGVYTRIPQYMDWIINNLKP